MKTENNIKQEILYIRHCSLGHKNVEIPGGYLCKFSGKVQVICQPMNCLVGYIAALYRWEHDKTCWQDPLMGYYTPNLKLACLVCYLKITNTNLKNCTCKLSKKLENCIEILVDQVVLSYGSKQSKYCFDQ